MRGLGGLLLMAVLLLGSRAQGQRITDWGRQIEQVHSVAGASALLERVLEQEIEPLDSLQLDLREHCQGCGVTIPPPWQKTDIDGDGRADLLICDGYYNLLFLNQGSARPLVLKVPLTRSNRGLCRTAALARRNGKYLIEGWETDRADNRDPEYGPPMYRHYVLTYQLGALVDYVARPRWWLPQAIELTSYNGYPGHSHNSYYKVMVKSGWVEAQDGLIEDSTYFEHVRFQLRSGQLDTLRQRLRYLWVGGLLSKYINGNAFDASKQTMTLYYWWRPPKKVRMYAESLPHTAKLIREELLATFKQERERRKGKKP